MKIVLDEGAILPTRAHPDDAGLDLYSPVDAVVKPGTSWCIDTGVHVEIPRGYVGMLKSKSGLLFRHNVTSEGVVDAGYTGSIRVNLMNHSDWHYTVHAGDKITQLVILPILTPELEVVSSLGDTERGAGGFGSTGR